MPSWNGVILSHLNLLSSSGTSSDPSPIRPHVREYVCPSVGDALGVMTSVSGGTISMCISLSYYNMTNSNLPVTTIVTLLLVAVRPSLVASHTYSPLLEGSVCLRGVKERVADVSPDTAEPSLSHR